MAYRIKNRKIVIQSEKEFWKKTKKLAKDIDKGKYPKQAIEKLCFTSLEAMRKTLTPKKLEIIKIIKHKKPSSIYELAKMIDMDYKNLIRDIKELKLLGLVSVKKEGKKKEVSRPIVSFDKISVEMEI